MAAHDGDHGSSVSFMARRVAPVVNVKVPLAGLPKELEGFHHRPDQRHPRGAKPSSGIFVEAIVDSGIACTPT